MRLQYGQEVSGLRVVGILGEGATAIVYLVEDPRANDTLRALKLLSVMGRSHRKRMTREGAAAGLVRHPNVVEIVELIDHAGLQGVLMEYVEGPTLYHWLTAHSPTIDEALALTVGILRGVDALHDVSLVHRDLKPSNVILGIQEDGSLVPKLVDFGLVKDTDLRDRLTQTGVAMGTPAYMSPEQLRDASRVDARADLYSVGCLLFEMLTGRAPFRREDWWETYREVESGVRADLGVLPDELAPAVRNLIGRLLEPRPEDRPATSQDALLILEVALKQAGHPVLSGTVPGDTDGAGIAKELAAAARTDRDNRDLWGDGAAPDEDVPQPPTPEAADPLLTQDVGMVPADTPTPAPRRQDTRLPVLLFAGSASLALLGLIAAVIWILWPTGDLDPVALGDTDDTDTSLATVLLTDTDSPGEASGDTDAPPDGATTTDTKAETTAGVTGADEATQDPDATGTDEATQDPDATDTTQDTTGRASDAAVPADTDAPSDGTASTDGESVAMATDTTPSTRPADESGSAEGEEDPSALEASEPRATLETDATEVRLVGPAGVVDPAGEIPPGTYEILVRWTPGDELVPAGSVTVPEEGGVEISCMRAFFRCRTQ